MRLRERMEMWRDRLEPVYPGEHKWIVVCIVAMIVVAVQVGHIWGVDGLVLLAALAVGRLAAKRLRPSEEESTGEPTP